MLKGWLGKMLSIDAGTRLDGEKRREGRRGRKNMGKGKERSGGGRAAEQAEMERVGIDSVMC